MRKLLTFTPAFAVLLASLIALLLAPELVHRVSSANQAAKLTLVRQAAAEDDVLERLDRATRNIAKIVEPSVVHIDVMDAPSGRRILGMSSGSGWIFDNSGNIVTNNHVVSGSTDLAVQFADGRRQSAKVVGSDPYTDVAVIQVGDSNGLAPAERATGDRPEKGQRVYAFGSPFGYKFSMSEGIISGLGRTARPGIDLQFSNFIQHDAAMNPGNSGGPLVDIHGRVVGMNVAIATARDTQGSTAPEDVGQSAGVSFAIPLATIESVAKQLIANGKVQRGFLGVSFQSGGDTFRKDGTFLGRGVLIRTVEPDLPAEKAGMKVGDIITHINGERIVDGDIMRAVISSTAPGTELKLKVWREEQNVDLTLTLGAMPESVLARPRQQMLANLRDALGLSLTEQNKLVGVEEVAPESPAEKFGVKKGHIIRSVNGREVESADDFTKALIDGGILRLREVEVVVEFEGVSENLKFNLKD